MRIVRRLVLVATSLGAELGNRTYPRLFPKTFEKHIHRKSSNSPRLSAVGDQESSVMWVV
jgi:hypothetical protein